MAAIQLLYSFGNAHKPFSFQRNGIEGLLGFGAKGMGRIVIVEGVDADDIVFVGSDQL